MKFPQTTRSRLLAGIVLLAAALIAPPASGRESSAPPAPVNLLCEYQTNPIGLDVTIPRLSWRLADERRGARQRAYQVLVADSPELLAKDQGNLWDTGQVQSDQSVHVEYKGAALQPRQVCYWKVRTWDQDLQASPYSEPSQWEMGLLSLADWKADWIEVSEVKSPSPEIKWGDWIWMEGHLNEDGCRVYLRKSFEIAPGVKVMDAVARVSVDNEYTLYLNGTRIGEGGRWQAPDEYDIAAHLTPGRNVIALEGRNRVGDCGALLGLAAHLESGEPLWVQSDASWKISDQTAEGWLTPGFDDSNWKAPVIVAKYGDPPWGRRHAGYTPNQPRMFREEFDLCKPVRMARAYVTAAGCYDLTLNGQRAGINRLAPEWTDYNKRIQYQTYDVTQLVTQGPNAIGLVVGNGWWGGELMGRPDSNYHGGPFKVLCQIEVEFTDGSRKMVFSDKNWSSRKGPILFDSLYHGETYDARLETPGWDKPGFAEEGWEPVQVSAWTPPKLLSQQCETIQPTEELTPVSVTEPSPGAFVFDMGQNMVGVARLSVTGPAGTTVQLRFAEVLNPDGTLYTENYRGARCTDRYTLKGTGVEVWEPRFTYRGFRYVEVTGYPGLPTQEAITGVVFHTAVMKIGEFACSNELLNQIQKNITWGLRGNLHSIPTDCPQRDERLGWAGDAQAIGPTICRNFGMARFFSKWITDLADTQNADEGWVTDVAPTLGGSAAAPGWGDALVIVPWTVYQEYGDRRILEENYEAMSKWVGYMKKKSQNGLYNPEHIYGDWVASVESPKPPMASAYYYYSTSLMARIATLLNRQADANRFRAWMLVTRQAFNQAYFDETKRDYEGGTQAAKVLPLHFGLVNEDFAPGVAANLIRDIQERGYHLSTGFPGSAVMMPELTKWADTETLWKLAVQDTYPSWGYMVRKGATTIWELWNSDTAGPGMNSRNHYAFGAVGQWYFQTLAGIDSDETAPGYKRVHFRPTPMGGLEWAKASITTLYGLVSSEWHLDKEGFRLAITVPPNTTGLLEIPTFGSNKPTILEGKETILSLGKPSRSKGIRYQGLNNGRAAFELEAGRYEFRVGK